MKLVKETKQESTEEQEEFLKIQQEMHFVLLRLLNSIISSTPNLHQKIISSFTQDVTPLKATVIPFGSARSIGFGFSCKAERETYLYPGTAKRFS